MELKGVRANLEEQVRKKTSQPVRALRASPTIFQAFSIFSLGTLLPSVARLPCAWWVRYFLRSRSKDRARIQRAHSRLPFSARELGFAKDCFFACQALHAPTLTQTIRAYNWWEAGAPRARARSRTRFARVIECKLSPRAFIGQELFWNFVKRYTGD